jgi:hypothetical protein
LGSENGKIDKDSLQVLSRFEQIFVPQKAEEESQGFETLEKMLSKSW